MDDQEDDTEHEVGGKDDNEEEGRDDQEYVKGHEAGGEDRDNLDGDDGLGGWGREE